MFWNKYPYTNFHEINLDWILARMMELNKDLDEFKALNTITFDGEWNITKQYPAWCIVNTNGGQQGYISVKPVPAGVLITNTDYWVSIVDYTAVIGDLQNRVVQLESETADLYSKVVPNINTLENISADTNITDNSYSTNSKSVSNGAIMTVNGADIEGYDITSTSNPVIEAGTDVGLKGNDINAHIIAVNMNDVGDNVKILENDIIANDYGVLIQRNNNGHDFIVAHNNIEATEGDAVEIDTPYNEATSDCTGVIVTANHLKASGAYGATRGFAFGCARGRDVILANNVIGESALEAVHIEDNPKRVIVTGNIFNECHLDGAWLATNYSKSGFTVNGLTNGGRPVIITNNVFNAAAGNTSTGLRIVHNSDTDDSIVDMRSNIVSGFQLGIWSDSYTRNVHARNFDGCIITDCANGMAIGDTYNVGEVTFSDISGYILRVNGFGHLDGAHILDAVDIDNFIDVGSTPTMFTLNKLTMNVTQNMVDGTPAKLFKIPAGMNGKLTLEFIRGTARTCYVYETDGSTLTQIAGQPYGAISFTPSISGGYVIASTYNISTPAQVIAKLTFEGVLVYKN